jgi:hypothetical protein
LLEDARGTTGPFGFRLEGSFGYSCLLFLDGSVLVSWDSGFTLSSGTQTNGVGRAWILQSDKESSISGSHSELRNWVPEMVNSSAHWREPRGVQSSPPHRPCFCTYVGTYADNTAAPRSTSSCPSSPHLQSSSPAPPPPTYLPSAPELSLRARRITIRPN